MGDQVFCQDLLLLRDWSLGKTHTHTHTGLVPFQFLSSGQNSVFSCHCQLSLQCGWRLRAHGNVRVAGLDSFSCVTHNALITSLFLLFQPAAFFPSFWRRKAVNVNLCNCSVCGERARGGGALPVVLGGGARSFISRLHSELSNYTRAERFTAINLPPALRALPLFLPFLFFFYLASCSFFPRRISHTDNNFDSACVCAHACWEWRWRARSGRKINLLVVFPARLNGASDMPN